MIRVRKLVLAIAAATSLTSGMAHALGLGEISLQSALNQPLNANIELLEVRDLGQAEIIPRLASAEDFSKAGVERDYFLSDLKFTPVIMPNGKSVLRVTSNKPVREPYLNFLVEVIWPSGRVLREYTLLLDPPMYSPETAVAAAPRLPVAVPAPAYAPVSAPRTQSQPIDGPFKVGSLPGSAAKAAPAARTEPQAAAVKAAPLDGQYKTSRNDTLWEIAQRVKGGGSLNQTMLAIQDLNPDAFIAGNINRLKSGQVLRLPDAEQINSRSRADASAAVAEQNSAWRDGRSLAPVAARQLDATKRTSAGEAPAQVETKDSLRLVAADTGKAATASDKGAGADGKALADKLAVTQESLDTSRRQGEELKGRVAELQGQLEKLQRLAELKDNQLAKLQADLAAQEKLAAESAAKASAVAATAPVPAVAPAEVAVEQSKPEATPPAPVAETPPVAAAPEVSAKEPEPVKDFNYSEDAPAKTEPAAPTTTAEVQPKAAEVPVEAVEPVQIVTETVVEAAPEPVSLFDELMANPLLLGAGGAGLLVVLLGLMALSRRNALKENASDEGQSSVASTDDDNSFAAEMDLSDESFAGLDDAISESSEEPVKAQTADALGEAEIYIAYGKFNQAAELLQNAINEEPQRADLQLKLMEVMAELGDRDGFQRQESELQELGGVSAQIEQIKAKYPAVVAASFAASTASVTTSDELDEFTLDDLAPDAALAAAAQDADDAFDLSLDELDGGVEDDLQVAAPTAPNLDEFSLDFELDEPVAVKTADDQDFDLSLDDLGGEPEAFEPTASHKLDDDLSDFNLELETELASADADNAGLSLSLEDDLAFDAPELVEKSPDFESSFVAEAEQPLTSDFDLSVPDDQQALEPISDEFDAKLDEVNNELDHLAAAMDEPLEQLMPEELEAETALVADEEDDFDFLSGTDETATKLDLARAYIDMGDAEGARDILDEVIAEGNESQQQEARDLIGKLV